MTKNTIVSGLTIIGLVVVAIVAWVLITSTGESATDTATEDVLNTATVSRADVSDTAELVGELRFQGAVDLVHRVDPVLTTVTTTIEQPVATPAPSGGGGEGGSGEGGSGEGGGGAGPATPTPTTQTVTETVETPGQRTVTGLPRPGAVIAPGDVLYETDSTPVFTALGDAAAWRTIDSTTSGPDVAQLQQYLFDGGWAIEGFPITGEGDVTITTAIQNWQDDTGQPVTGTVALGDIWFISGPIRVTDVQATEGVVIADGASILSYTSSERAIEATVEEIPDGLLQADELIVRLPGVGQVPATLRSTSGTNEGFDLLLDVESSEGVPEVDGIDATVSWTTSEIVDALTVPPEALRRIDTGEFIADVVVGGNIEPTTVEVVGQAGRLVAITGLIEGVEVLIP